MWPSEHKITAIELDSEIANVYGDLYPDDQVIVGDAHAYLLKHYSEYDFIWASPPCPTHSLTNHFLNAQGVVRYPDMALYQEIILLKTFCKSVYAIENVVSYYEPLISPQQTGRHFIWSNFYITPFKVKCPFNTGNMRANTRKHAEQLLIELQNFHNIDLSRFDISIYKKADYLRNCVKPEIGAHIFRCAFNGKQVSVDDYESQTTPDINEGA